VSLEQHRAGAPRSLRFAVLTISDTRELATDRGGDYLAEAIAQAGHSLVRRRIVRDEPEEIRSAVDALAGEAEVDLVLTTGGTGIAPRDRTYESLHGLFDREIPGFGELFRWLSYQEIGSAAILSRATAGLIRSKVVIALPGSPKALRLAWEKILLPEAGHLVAQAR
jgi:molybdenum cofactor biosynthesis protein B